MALEGSAINIDSTGVRRTIQTNAKKDEQVSTLMEMVKNLATQNQSQHSEQLSSHKKTQDRLSPKTTILIALFVGISASFIASALFSLWNNLQPNTT